MKTTVKTITFAITHFTVAFTVAYLLTGSWVIGGAIALVEPAINTVAYVIHEKLWESPKNSWFQHEHSMSH
ncbi:DUF2061 domain-containing protein [Neiella marina]|uniref:DUF2061 domain-containing protein n=1 Tax=Neiella holothuriorum TaxID=2870530 RepID=A0ABS7EDW9_9GAMM|nr:DUF2061 domain-containing protein [Neiella holothuriorum]MBW8190532.1 DUF2061 domain-containing protein [Neiella holothuriorum]